MQIRTLMERLEKVLPTDLIDEGDNSGLLIGRMGAEVSHIRVALEATDEVIDRAVADDADLLLVHHPMIFGSIRTVTDETVEGRKAMKLIENGMGLIAAHSNLDRAPSGLNRYFGSLLDLEEVTAYEPDSYICIGALPDAMTLKELTDRVSHILGTPCINYVGDDDRQVYKVAFCTGSGMSLIEEELFEQADVYLTGDLKYHDAMSVHEMGQAVVDITHFGSEVFAAEVLMDMVQQVAPEVAVTMDRAIVNPIKQRR